MLTASIIIIVLIKSFENSQYFLSVHAVILVLMTIITKKPVN